MNVEKSKTTVCASVSSDLHNTIALLSVEPITLENEEENEIIHTYRLLDKGSEAFLIRDDVADTKKLKRRPSNLTITLFHRKDPCSPALLFEAAGHTMFRPPYFFHTRLLSLPPSK